MKNNKFLKIIAVVLLVITTAFVTRMITVRQVLSSNEDFGKVIVLEKYLRENYLYNKDIKDENLEAGLLKGLVAGLGTPIHSISLLKRWQSYLKQLRENFKVLEL